jgi:hypothetical protein
MPWTARFCGVISTIIVIVEANRQILCGTDIKFISDLAMKNVYEIHIRNIMVGGT